jgi:hypothetical protein
MGAMTSGGGARHRLPEFTIGDEYERYHRQNVFASHLALTDTKVQAIPTCKCNPKRSSAYFGSCSHCAAEQNWKEPNDEDSDGIHLA